MFFLLGTRTKAKPLGQLERPCTKCGRNTMQTAVGTKRWFTLFFIPVIPLGTSQVVRCNLCGLTLKAPPELSTQLSSKAMAAGA
jgi:zinc-ribbon family